ncbi:ThiF family adenylyltransferase [uncultured Williamsia sp.]|uniref:ThiF family adenylyltransferase n=1 Tax=uncultured Williamsia sp. TaxID=259311 RepID=UPI002604B666|nr:ThiF family adenylyltransferase [uncultured Williamsia sp.]
MPDAGHELARRQLRELAAASEGAIELVGERSTSAHVHVFDVSLDTSGLQKGDNGIQIRGRELFEITIGSSFPFDPPRVHSAHRRWAGTPHVQWGRFLCLYVAPGVEWDPADGMYGFLTRLTRWLENAAAGTLDPEGQPLHPPTAYASASAGTVLVHPDLGDRVPWDAAGDGSAPTTVFAWCVVDDRRIDVLEWVDAGTAAARVLDDTAPVFHDERPCIVVATTLIPGQLGFEYPQTVRELSRGLAAHGYSDIEMLWDLASGSLMNRWLRKRQLATHPEAAGELWVPDDDSESPLVTAMLVGTPSRRVDEGEHLAHLAAWHLDSFSSRIANLYGSVRGLGDSDLPERVESLAQGWFEAANVGWMQLMENRSEVTRRRDHSAPTSWLRGKKVLVLGCGALGGPTAEYCVRAGVRHLAVADKSVVGPGVLVRQLFTDADIGQSKARALAARLSAIRRDLSVDPLHEDVRFTDHISNPAYEYDLVIDATADASVRSAIERAWKGRAHRPALVTMVIGHEASRGLVTTNLPTANGAGTDTFRKVALLRSSETPGWHDLGEDLFPREPRTAIFFPEPGCSAPTFVGSAAQTAALAGLMLNEATSILTSVSDADAQQSGTPTQYASAVRLGAASPGNLGTTRASWKPDLVTIDRTTSYEVRIAAAAYNEVAAEVRRGERIRGPLIETGGMLLGAFDDATGVIHVDRVAGPPPDSFLSRDYFQHGIEGVQTRVENEVKRTSGTSGFLGFWHTHPCGPARPSQTDEQGMASIVAPDGSRQRALMMILGGSADRWNAWRTGKAGNTPDVYARVVPRSTEPPAPGHPGYVGGRDLQQLPPGTYFRGGTRGTVHVTAGGLVRAITGVPDRAGWLRLRRRPRRAT